MTKPTAPDPTPVEPDPVVKVVDQSQLFATLAAAGRRVARWSRPSRQEDAEALQALRNRFVDAAQNGWVQMANDIAREITACQAQIVDRVEFVFGAIPAKRMQQLMLDHRTDRTAPNGQRMDWDDQTFPVALIHASLLEVRMPEGVLTSMTEAQVSALFDSSGWSQADFDDLFATAFNLSRMSNGFTVGAAKNV